MTRLFALCAAIVFGILAFLPSAQAQTRLGLFYTAEELAIWRQRMAGANDVNYKANTADGLPGDFDRIKAYADEYLANPTANLWQGSTIQGNNYPVYEGVKLQQAAFCYQLFKLSNSTLANSYAAAARTGLLTQITITAANVSLWNASTVGEDGVNESRWITRLVVAADYLNDYLSTADKALLNAWFLAQANFMAAHIQAKEIGQCFPQRLNNNYTVVGRDAKPQGESYGIYIRGSYPDGNEYTHRNADGSLGNKVSQLALHWNNRMADKANMVGMVGCYLNNNNLIFQAKQYAKEWLKYSVYPDGTQGEYERNGDYNLPQQGMAYGAINLWQYIMLADACARRGDMDLYNYSTSEGLHGTQGGPKSLRLVVEKYCKSIQGNPAIYHLTVTPNNRLDSYGEAANVELMWDVIFSVPNKLWQSNYINSIYTRTAPGVRPYATPPVSLSSAAGVWYPWGGTGAELPAVLYQFGQMETLVRPYAQTVVVDVPTDLRVPYVLQRSTQMIWDHAIGAVAYNLRYKPVSSSVWVTVNNLINMFLDVKTLEPATQYEWQVQAVGASTTSAWSTLSYFSTPASCVGTGSIVRELWTNQTGYFIWQTSSLPLGRTANSTSNISTLDVSTNSGTTNYFSRTRGFLCAPTTGAYTFWVSGDDEAELWLSTDDDPANATRIATTKWTNVREYTRYSTQRSATINLIASQRYYIEVRQLQVGGNDHFSVRWQLPSGTIEAPIPSSRISPFVLNRVPTVTVSSDKTSYTNNDDIVLTSNPLDTDGSIIRVDYYLGNKRIGTSFRAPFSYAYQQVPEGTYNFRAVAMDNAGDTSLPASLTLTVAPTPVVPNNPPPASLCATGTITREFWSGIAGNWITTVPVQNPTNTTSLAALETVSNSADAYGQRLRGYICPPVTGDYTFWVAGDDQTELWLSTNEDTANKVRIAFNTTWTNFREYTKFPSQRSALINLAAGNRYYIEVVHKEGVGGDNLSVQWQIPGGVIESPIPGTRLSPWAGIINYNCRSTGSITRETWSNVTGDISAMDWTRTPWWRGSNGNMEPPRNINENYAQRLLGFVCPPLSGMYTFSIAGDEQAELWLANSELPSGAQRVAWTTSPTLVREYNRSSTQSYTVWLSAGRRYYIEARHREVTGNDHLSIQWTLPTGAMENPIPSTRLATLASGALREGLAEGFLPQAEDGKVRLSLFPNPAKESIFLATNVFAEGNWEVTLNSQLGQEIKRFSPAFTEDQLKVELKLDELDLPAGVYLIHVKDGQGVVHNLRFVKTI